MRERERVREKEREREREPERERETDRETDRQKLKHTHKTAGLEPTWTLKRESSPSRRESW